MKQRFCKTFMSVLIMSVLALAVGCGSGGGKNPITVGQHLVDPSGNWKMSFTDQNANDVFILSGLFSQTGPNVTGISFSEVGNQAPGFQCAAQPDITMTNGLVQNVNQFSGDLHGNFGTIHFSATLNDPGTHASGTYTVTPPQTGNCLGVALTGTFTGDEVPSMTGAWTGTITCTANCPIGSTTGNLTMNLTQNDATGAVTGSYTVTDLPGLSTGNTVADTNNLLSGASLQLRFLDNIGPTTYVLVGGPLNSFGTAGVGLDRTFHGTLLEGDPSQPFYAVNMSH